MSKKVSIALTALAPVLTYFLFEFYINNPLVTMFIKTHLLNIFFYEAVFFLLWGICKAAGTALMLESGFFMIIGLINYYVIKFRSSPIMPWDIYSVKTALSVADNYSFVPEVKTVIVFLLFIALMATEFIFSRQFKLKLKPRLIMVVAALLVLVGYVNHVQSDSAVRRYRLYDKLYTPTVMSKKNGSVVSFIMELKYISAQKPEGYDAGEQEEKYKELSEVETDSGRKPNVIVIMNEAFSDLGVLGDFETNEDYMPFVHELMNGKENTISGYLNVSVLGGNTADTEFEFLTGNTMGFFPQGCIPYQQYVLDETPSLASYFRALGYDTIAFHPYKASGWDRNRVYPLLGFDTFLSIDDMENPEIVRKYVSDKSDYEKIISLYEQKEADKPLFIFNVTMQNHGGYEEQFDNFRENITPTVIKNNSLSQYLSLIKLADEQIEMLLSYFENVDEDTVIVFFGDHQPASNVSNEIWVLNGKNANNLQEEDYVNKYKVPYFIWANFDIEEATEQETSTNYLAMDILNCCGLSLPANWKVMADIREEYPVITAIAVKDKAGRLMHTEDCTDALSDYHKMAYYLMFDFESKEEK